MSNPNFQAHGGNHTPEHPPHGPYWKRMHHSPLFWVAAMCIMLAMGIYVMTNNLSVAPGAKQQTTVHALAP